jgi:hypothetical protein
MHLNVFDDYNWINLAKDKNIWGAVVNGVILGFYKLMKLNGGAS